MISKSNTNSAHFREVRAAMDPVMLEELVEVTANQSLLTYPSITNEYRGLISIMPVH